MLDKRDKTILPKYDKHELGNPYNCGGCGYPINQGYDYCPHCGCKILWRRGNDISRIK